MPRDPMYFVQKEPDALRAEAAPCVLLFKLNGNFPGINPCVFDADISGKVTSGCVFDDAIE